MNSKNLDDIKLTHFIPQTAASTTLRDPIPAISHLEKFGLRQGYF